jgi:hypothetical protein
MTKNILFICGSLNQTTMMHQISRRLNGYNAFFSPFYADGFLKLLSKLGLLDFTILGKQHRNSTERYLRKEGLAIDYGGGSQNYDLMVTGTDLIVQKNIRGKRLILVQEGIMEAETLTYQLVRRLGLPRFLANTAATGLSDAYDIFCVASPGYRDLFIRKGIKPKKMVVTGIPNFDDVNAFKDNNFPYHNFVLVATSPLRESFRPDDRKQFIQWAKEIANGRQMIFKLHPLERIPRACLEIKRYAPDAIVYWNGNANHMIANCEVLVTQYSSVTFVGLALGKQVNSLLNLDEARALLPIQNNGASANNIARICETVVHMPVRDLRKAGGRLRLPQSVELGSIDLL